MHSQGLSRCERLKGRRLIERLFDTQRDNTEDSRPCGSVMAYPWRARWRETGDDADAMHPVRFAIIVPKRRLRHAVDRVKARRRCREAMRLNRPQWPAGAVDMAFVYIGDGVPAYDVTEVSVRRILARISTRLQS